MRDETGAQPDQNNGLRSLFDELIVAAEGADEVQQTGEQVVNADIQGDRCHDVVGLTTVHDFAGLIKNQTRHQQHKHSRNSQ